MSISYIHKQNKTKTKRPNNDLLPSSAGDRARVQRGRGRRRARRAADECGVRGVPRRGAGLRRGLCVVRRRPRDGLPLELRQSAAKGPEVYTREDRNDLPVQIFRPKHGRRKSDADFGGRLFVPH